jgi:hypothetical protein
MSDQSHALRDLVSADRKQDNTPFLIADIQLVLLQLQQKSAKVQGTT